MSIETFSFPEIATFDQIDKLLRAGGYCEW
jgi:hypothetical protein